MRTLNGLFKFIEKPRSEWSRTQRQLYIDWVFASIVAVSEGEDIEVTKLMMFARVRMEILERKEVEELSDGGKPADLKLSQEYKNLAAALLKSNYAASFWAKLEAPAVQSTKKRWPSVLRDVYLTGAIVLAFDEKRRSGFNSKLGITKIVEDVPRHLHRDARVYTHQQTLYDTWSKMSTVAHYCAAILKLIPPNSGQFLDADSRLFLASHVVDFLNEADKYSELVRNLESTTGKSPSAASHLIDAV